MFTFPGVTVEKLEGQSVPVNWRDALNQNERGRVELKRVRSCFQFVFFVFCFCFLALNLSRLRPMTQSCQSTQNTKRHERVSHAGSYLEPTGSSSGRRLNLFRLTRVVS